MRTGAWLLVAVAVFAAVWLAVHPPLPQLPNGDIYTSLGVARYIANGDGLVNGSVYPLFTAYPWGKTMPQPLIHRPPGLAVLLLPAWYLGGGDPVRVESLVRPTMVVALVLIALLGVVALQRRGRFHVAPAWLLLLLVNPLLALAVDWGWSEIPAAFLLLVLWLMIRRRSPADFSIAAAAAYAVLSGLLALIRGDVLWIPVLWWFVTALVDRRRRVRAVVIRTTVAAVVGVAVLLPWWLHVTSHSGSPLANPLTEAVQLDLSEEWWDYPRLRSRTPLPLGQNLREHAGPAVLKILTGVRSYTRTLGLWLPWYFWLACFPIWLERTWKRSRRGHDSSRAAGPMGLMSLTMILMVIQYALFSPETRHMLPVLPLVAWEGLLIIDDRLTRVRSRRWRGAALAAMTGIALLLSPTGLGGETGNVQTAIEQAAIVEASVAQAADLPPGPVFSDNAVVPWRLGRPCVWSPYDDAVEAEIRDEVAGMADAPWVRLLPVGAGDVLAPDGAAEFTSPHRQQP